MEAVSTSKARAKNMNANVNDDDVLGVSTSRKRVTSAHTKVRIHTFLDGKQTKERKRWRGMVLYKSP
jgi:hypothetical protein